MKFVLFVFMTSCVVLISGQFSKKLENLNVDNILKNDRILTNYVKCLLEKGPCTNEGRELKITLPQTLKAGCEKCSEAERKNSKKVISHLIKKKPQMWAELEAKYDPTGENTRAFRQNVNA